MGITSAIFLQARIASTRLPAKILKIVENKTIIEHIISRLQECLPYVDNITILSSFDAYPKIKKIFEKYENINLFAGKENEENNVLKRFYNANEQINTNHIIRTTADNPFTSILHLKSSLEKHINNSADLTIYKNLPLGSGVEIIKASALNQAYKYSVNNYDKEHVTPYIYKNKNKFKILTLETDQTHKRPDIRLTVDQIEDLTVTKTIFKELYNGYYNNFSLKEIIELYDRKKLHNINGHIVQKYS